MHHGNNAEGDQSHCGEWPTNVPKVRPVHVSKSSASIFNPLVNELGGTCPVIEHKDKAMDEICQNQLDGVKVELDEQSHGENHPKSIAMPKPRPVSNASGSQLKPLARKAFGFKGKFKPLKR